MQYTALSNDAVQSDTIIKNNYKWKLIMLIIENYV